MDQQNGFENLDEKLARFLTKEDGFFIEVGAGNGLGESSTLCLENRGWQGMLIEPVIEQCARCTINRPKAAVLNYDCVAHDQSEGLVNQDEFVQQSKSRRVKGNPSTLTLILDELQVERIDLLVVNAGDYGLNVLKGLDLVRYRPEYMFVEESLNGEILPYLSKYYYEPLEGFPKSPDRGNVLYRSIKNRPQVFTDSAIPTHHKQDIAPSSDPGSPERYNEARKMEPHNLERIHKECLPRRLHIGGLQAHPEWEIFNAVPTPNVDHVGNAKDLSRFPDRSFSDLYASHVLEHFDHAGELGNVLREWHRVLRPAGKLYISVPDMDKLAKLFLMKDNFSLNDRLWIMRMMFGGHTDEYDYHKVGLNREILEHFLTNAGFVKMKVMDEFGVFKDTSIMKCHGVPISINIMAEKPDLDSSLERNHNVLASLLKEAGYNLSFTILEIGARPIGKEPFHILLRDFPSSRIFAFEVDPILCKELNRKATVGIHHYPYALGKTEEERTFYDTQHPMCSSLYKPNEALLDIFQNLEVSKLKQTFTIQTISIDHFAAANNIGPVDFIKIDIRGAELDVFEGGKNVLKDVLAVVSKVEFVPIYEEQPLFGDVSAFLQKHGMIFHKFLGLAGRAVKPIVFKNDLNYPSQHLWSDAVFIRDFLKPDLLGDSQLLKTALLMHYYGSPDMAHFIVRQFDLRNNTLIADEYLRLLTH